MRFEGVLSRAHLDERSCGEPWIHREPVLQLRGEIYRDARTTFVIPGETKVLASEDHARSICSFFEEKTLDGRLDERGIRIAQLRRRLSKILSRLIQRRRRDPLCI